MHLRHTAAAAVASLALLFATPCPAAAAAGEFRYTYYDDFGNRTIGKLVDPASRVCHTLREVANPDTTEPAFAPQNLTGSTVTMFTGPDCEGEYYSLRPGGRASDRLELRSAVFS
ncbi:hypothetical protein [Kitasatospora sp. CB01950]|uniref:hypothetical protein n=1 Tax=Kitasatospora sp. CB01950 TaxID=1703930 RepID=UPI00093CECA0|nr:hypothetical protein [Kitasatospora sp. CB01950]OKJ13946.1 hypothetical protein AMK19_11350 [Kitasatospora sp. CB01950]